MEKKEDGNQRKIKDKKLEKAKKLKRKRIIVRNLSFKVTEEELKSIFSEYGNVLEVTIPLKKDGKTKKGFAFVQFSDTFSLIRSMKALNYKPIKGRPIAIDYAIDKTKYQEKHPIQDEKNSVTEKSTECKAEVLSESEDSDFQQVDLTPDTNVSDNEEKANKFLKEFGLEEELNNDSSDESSDDEMVESNDEIADLNNSKDPKKCLKKVSNDVSEGKTVFIRNLSFNSEEEDLQEIMEKYGECKYCLMCIDKLTEHPKGTAFVKFEEASSAQKLVDDASKDPGIFLDGRKLFCDYAISQGDISEKTNKEKKSKDKRNLTLLKCSIIIPGSSEAEGVSQSDWIKRKQLEMSKKEKLKNTNFFVSDKRVVIHNLPENFTDAELRKLFKSASVKGAVITEARIMRDFKKTDGQGVPFSKGFGFVSFTCHEHALKALMHLNNNPTVFTSSKRPIVEFSIENIEAILSKERKIEKNRMRNKLRTDEKNERKAKAAEQNLTVKEENSTSVSLPAKRRKRKRERNIENEKKKKIPKVDLFSKSDEPEVKSDVQKKKKQKNKKKTNKKGSVTSMNKEDKKDLSELANKYKTKLLNKLS